MTHNSLLEMLNFYKIIGINQLLIQNYLSKKPKTSKNLLVQNSTPINNKTETQTNSTLLTNTNIIENNIVSSVNVNNYNEPPTKAKPEINNTYKPIKLDHISTLKDLKQELDNFNDCSLKFMANNTVFGAGNEQAKVLLIGEAPGSEEDETGEPFVGRSGQLLMKAISYIGLNRDNVFITNRVFWRPPGNRTPSIDEINMCEPFVFKIIEILNPKLIICVGKTSSTNILNNEEAVTNQVGKNFSVNINNNNYTVRAVYHPAYLLRQPTKKALLWLDLIEIKNFLENI